MRTSLSLRFTSVLILLAACAVMADARGIIRQRRPTEPKHIITDEFYAQVLDIVFPRTALGSAFGYAFILRYKPSFGPESQVVILNDGDSVKVIEYVASDGGVYAQLSKVITPARNTKAMEVAKLIRVRKRTVSVVPADIERLRVGFYDSLSDASNYEKTVITENRNVISVTTDGTQYLLWYRGAARISFDLTGSSVEDSPRPNEHPLVTWMKAVRRLTGATTSTREIP